MVLQQSAFFSFSSITAFIMIVFGGIAIIDIGSIAGYGLVLLGFIVLLNSYLYFRHKNDTWASLIASICIGIALLGIFYSDSSNTLGVFWLAIYPVPVLMLMGRKHGLILVAVYAVLFIPSLVWQTLLPDGFSSVQVFNLFAALLTISSLVFMYEKMIGSFFADNLRQNQQLQKGTDTLSKQIAQREELESKMRTLILKEEENNHKLEELTQIDEATISSIGEAIIMVNQKGVTTKANVSTGRILGVNQNDLIGQKLTKVLPFRTVGGVERLEDSAVVIMQALSHRSIVEETYKIVRPDKSFLYAQMTASPLVVNGVVFGAVVAVRDVTQEINIDQAKTEFVSIASHQLRTPLSTINWYLEMILAGDFGAVAADQKEFIQEAYDASQRMGGLIDALLNVSRIDVGVFAIDPEPTDIGALVEEVMTDLQSRVAEKQQKISIDVDKKIGSLMLDQRLMHIVFLNLISNAVKYTPVKGSVSVVVAEHGPMIDIIVKDNGYGIPEHQQDKIFSKMFRAQNAVENEPDGTGLGLYIVKAIVDEVKGTISFESKEDVGTTFTVSLPKEGMPKRSGARKLSEKAGA